MSHVPPGRFDAFWHAVAAALKPQGRVFFIDSAPDQTSTERDHTMPGDDGVQERKLNDGRTFRVVKLFYDPAELSDRLTRLGWRATCTKTLRYFLHGEATLA